MNNEPTTTALSTTLMKGLLVLETLARKPEPCGVSRLARDVGMTKSNVHRTLQTLAAAGYVTQTKDGGYECTLKLFELSSAIMARVDVRQVAEPFMRRLADQTQETVHLSALHGAEVIYLHKIESPQPVRAYSQVGGRAPAFSVASGKALLAYASSAVLAALPSPLPRHTRFSLANAAQLDAELATVRQRGFALNRGEWRERVCGLAAPIFDGEGTVVASIGISGPVERFQPDIERLAPVVLEAARGVSAALGFNAYSERMHASRATALR